MCVTNRKEPKYIVVDLFCGAGGTTTGFASVDGVEVVACVNHDENAIKSHSANHPECEHYTEDITCLYGHVTNGILHMTERMRHLVKLVELYRVFYPEIKVILWASLECTNFSKAKGGKPRDADSRTLANHMDRYVIALRPDYMKIENVVEFMAWGPLDENGKPVSRRNGCDFMRWCSHIDSLGYRNEWRELNAADFGAYQSRERLFGVFATGGLPILWPEPTHGKLLKKKNSTSHQPDLFSLPINRLQPWKAVREVLDFSDVGRSIFDGKPRCDKTLERVYAGLVKFVAGGKEAFIVKYNSMAQGGGYQAPSIDEPSPTVATQNRLYMAFISKYYSGRPDGKNISVDGPAGTVTTVDGQALVNVRFVVQRNSGEPGSKLVDIDGPARAVTTTGGNQELVSTQFISAYYGNGDNVSSVEGPSPTVVTKDRLSLIQAEYYIMRDFTNGDNTSSIDTAAGTVMTTPKLNLVQVEPFVMRTDYSNSPTSVDAPSPTITADRHWHYIVNPQWGGNPGSVDNPSFTVIARQDKAPLYLVVAEGAAYNIAIRIDATDSPIMRKIKEFMVMYNITDIKMRMFRIPELLQLQGFPKDYKLVGTQADQKKFIGNAVHTVMPKVLISRYLN